MKRFLIGCSHFAISLRAFILIMLVVLIGRIGQFLLKHGVITRHSINRSTLFCNRQLERLIRKCTVRHLKEQGNPLWTQKLVWYYRNIYPFDEEERRSKYEQVFHFAYLSFQLTGSYWANEWEVIAIAKYAFLAGKMEDAQEIVETMLEHIQNHLEQLERKAGHDEKAQRQAKYLRTVFRRAEYYGNIIICRINLNKNHVKVAEKYLHEAMFCMSPDTFRGGSPDLSLAPDLMERGKTDVLIAYLERCAEVWEQGAPWLKSKIVQIQQGETPNFGTRAAWF